MEYYLQQEEESQGTTVYSNMNADFPLAPEFAFEITSCTCTAVKNACSSSDSCKCRRHGEPCRASCSCQNYPKDQLWHPRETCRNKPSPTDQLRPTRIHQAAVFCKCSYGSSRKRCTNSSKCSCRRAFKSCDKQTCKCHSSCANSDDKQGPLGDVYLMEQVRKWFLHPERGANQALVAQLVTETTPYRRAFFAGEKDGRLHVERKFHQALLQAVTEFDMPIHEIILYLPTSPCFHQECDPHCDVLDRCNANNACAETLAIAYKQAQNRTGRHELQMTVKFLASYVRRGDLYTKQGILCMMDAGMNVEPINMKEWIKLVNTAERENMNTSYYKDLWNRLNLVEYVLQTQFYINECRQEIGLKTLLWDGPLHTLLKNCIVSSIKAIESYTKIKKGLEKDHSKTLRRRCRSATLCKRSQSVESSLSRNSRMAATSRCSSTMPSGDPTMTNSLSTSFLGSGDQEALFPLAKNGPVLQYRSQQLTSTPAASELNTQSSTCLNMEDDQVLKLLVNLSGRSIDEVEAREITDEVSKATEDIRQRMTRLIVYLQRTIDSTAL